MIIEHGTVAAWHCYYKVHVFIYVKREYHEICEFNNFAAHMFVAINLTRFIFRRNLKIPMICCLPRKREKSPDYMDLTGSLEYFVLLPECWDGNRFPAFLGYPVYGRLSNLTRPDAAYQKLSSYRYAAGSEGYFCKDFIFLNLCTREFDPLPVIVVFGFQSSRISGKINIRCIQVASILSVCQFLPATNFII